MKVCVVGGAGYIGSHVVYELIRDGHDVYVIDNLTTGNKDMVHTKARLYHGDTREYKELDNIFKQEPNTDVVMHFAAKSIIDESVIKPLEYYDNNVRGVAVLLHAMVNNDIKNIIFSSSAAVYGEPTRYVCEEDDYCIPINPYGETKLAAERMIKWASNAYNMNYCVFRYFNVAGADRSLQIGLKKDNLTHLIPISINTALGLSEDVTIFGNDYPTKDGTAIRDYIHVTDVAKAHIDGAKYILEHDQSGIFNLGSSEGYTVKEVLKTVNKFHKIKAKFGPRRKGDPTKLIASIYKAKRILGWRPKLSLEDIIKTDLDFRSKISKKKTIKNR